MHIDKNQVPTKLEAPGATARQIEDFGTATGYGTIAGEYFSLTAGTDLSPLLQGLPGDYCHAPHWGYVIDGEVVVTYAVRESETCRAGELFYWPPGHSARVTEDVELILFSPQTEHAQVLEHMRTKLAGSTR